MKLFGVVFMIAIVLTSTENDRCENRVEVVSRSSVGVQSLEVI